jgi:hypothetical protein
LNDGGIVPGGDVLLPEKPIVNGEGNLGSDPHCLARIYVNQHKENGDRAAL